MSLLTVGVVGTSRKENERRVPIHPEQIDWIEDDLRKNLYFEQGYGVPFDVDDRQIAEKTGGMMGRDRLFEHCDVLLLPKPVRQDFEAMRENGILWGWPHCVQQQEFTQIAIDKRLTLIAWEAMHKWGKDGQYQMHIFNKNNEIAGYAGVLDAMRLRGIDGNYGPRRKAVVLSFGSVSRGATRALQSLGVIDITVFTQRSSPFVVDQIAGPEYRHMEIDTEGHLVAVQPDGQSYPFIEELATADIIVNGILQDTDNPLMFVDEDEVDRLKFGTLIVDISCDEGMGFPFARPTSFENPMFKVHDVYYYAVDHTPTYIWNSASWEISNSLLPFLPIVMAGPESWQQSETIGRAIEIRSGVIQNPKILSFQNRAAEYPHPVLEDK